MVDKRFLVRKVAVLGAGVMGAQIAAHLVNANIQTLLFELPADASHPNANVVKAVEKLKKQEPAPLSAKAKATYILAANYDQHLELLRDCDLVIEAIAERMDLKRDLYMKVSPYLGEYVIFASNTSGLSINKLSEAFPEALRHRFCGIHFFNPPRYMHLVELIACQISDADMLDQLEEFLVTYLGKGVIRAKDTPNFIANRIGVFSLLVTMYHGKEFNFGFDLVDALTGTLIGRPKSATFRTADVVGLDILAHVINTMHHTLPDDAWHPYFVVPDWLQGLIQTGALGEKVKHGIYQKIKNEICVFDLETGNYRPPAAEVDEDLKLLLMYSSPIDKFAVLRNSHKPQMQFLWSIFRDLFHYCAVQLQAIADNARDLDLAVRWGFGWNQGPFEIWQAAGWKQITSWIQEDIKAGRTMSQTPLPQWVITIADIGAQSVHTPQGSFVPATNKMQSRPKLPVYQRQLFPDRLIGEEVVYGKTIFETDSVRMWHTGDQIAILSFKSKMHTIGIEVLEGVQQAISEAEQNWHALVIWQTEPPFSAGANLKKATEHSKKPNVQHTSVMLSPPAPPSAFQLFLKKFKKSAQATVLQVARELDLDDVLMAKKLAEVDGMIRKFQKISQALRYSMIPTVAAVDGLALGGGCEFVMHCDRAIATLETYIGLVETGIGLLPAGGGCKEFALRAAQNSKDGDPFPQLKYYFQTVAMAELAKSAEQAKELGYLRFADIIVMHRFELLYIAKAQALALAEAGYRPPLKPKGIPVAGSTGIATFQSQLVNLHEGNFISEHDYLIGNKVAHVMCGGDLTPGSLVDEDWFLELERSAFMELLATEKTQARIEHTLKTGKPLRN